MNAEMIELLETYIAENFCAVERLTACSCGGDCMRDNARDYFANLPGGDVVKVFARRKPSGGWRVESVEVFTKASGGFDFAGDENARRSCAALSSAIEEAERLADDRAAAMA